MNEVDPETVRARDTGAGDEQEDEGKGKTDREEERRRAMRTGAGTWLIQSQESVTYECYMLLTFATLNSPAPARHTFPSPSLHCTFPPCVRLVFPLIFKARIRCHEEQSPHALAHAV